MWISQEKHYEVFEIPSLEELWAWIKFSKSELPFSRQSSHFLRIYYI